MSDAVVRAKAAMEGITDGPWTWTDPRYGPPDLMGRAGDPATYEYDTEVLEASHQGECGCRSVCELELAVGVADQRFIAAARTLVPELLAEVERLRSGLRDICSSPFDTLEVEYGDDGAVCPTAVVRLDDVLGALGDEVPQ